MSEGKMKGEDMISMNKISGKVSIHVAGNGYKVVFEGILADACYQAQKEDHIEVESHIDLSMKLLMANLLLASNPGAAMQVHATKVAALPQLIRDIIKQSQSPNIFLK